MSLIHSRARMKKMLALALAAASGLCLSASANATITQVTSAADFTLNDVVSWGQLVPDDIAATYFSPVTATSLDGLQLTISNNTGPSFDAEGTGYPGGPDIGNPLDFLLGNCCSFRPPYNYGDLTLTFSSPVRGAGAFAVFGGNLDSFVTMEINGDPSLRFSVSGNPSLPNGKRQLVFLGVMSDALDIRSLTFTSSLSSFNDIAIDNLRLNTLPAPPPPLGSAPEPASWAMMLVGFVSIGSVMRRRRGGSEVKGAPVQV